jgi:hypothetical protein
MAEESALIVPATEMPKPRRAKKAPKEKKERRKDDAYYTPPWPVRLLLRHWAPPHLEGVWVEPAVGSGNIVRATNEKYQSAEWWGYDINPTGQAADGKLGNLVTFKQDFLKRIEVCTRVSLSMSNPLFSLAGASGSSDSSRCGEGTMFLKSSLVFERHKEDGPCQARR